MQLAEVKAIVTKRFIEHLLPEDWNIRDESYGLWLEKESNNIKDFIYLNIKEHYDEEHLTKYHLVRPFGAKGFNIVEQVLSSCFNSQDNLDGATIYPYDFYDGAMDESLPKPLTGVVNYAELERDVQLMLKYMDSYIKPFFSKYPTLKEVDLKIQQIPIIDLHKFIGQEVIGRRMTIMKLAGNSSYEEYVKMILNYFEDEAGKGNSEAKNDLVKYSKLKECLTNIQPQI